MKLMSACLAGVNCKYSGGNNASPEMEALFAKGEVVLICPEQFGGLCTPRPPVEIEPGFDGEAVLAGKAAVKTADGQDLTRAFIKGAQIALEIARSVGADVAYLKEGSPSCGCQRIYDGTFSGVSKSGEGVCAALFLKNGIRVIGVE